MTTAFPTLFKEDYEKTRDESKTKLHRVQKEGELAGSIIHKYYKGKYDTDKKSYEELVECPAIVQKTGKPRKEGGKPTLYKAPIVLVARLESLTPIKDVCERTDDGRYKVLAKVEYMSSATKDTDRLFSDWARDNYKALYDEHDQTFDEKFRSQMKNYVAPTGEIAKQTFIRLSVNSDVTIKCSDAGALSVFRQRLEGSNLKKVRRHTKLNLTNITVTSWVYMQKVASANAKEDASAEQTSSMYVPRFSYFFKPGNVELAPGEERYKSISRRMSENESPDKHVMVFPPLVESGKAQVPSSVYFLVRDNYSTPIPVQNSEGAGVSIKIDSAEKQEDVTYTDNDLNKIKRMDRDMTIYQWTNSPEKVFEKYRVQLKGPRDNGKMAERYGILDTEAYGLIMFAHHDVTHHALCSLWWSATFRNTPDNAEKALVTDKTGTRGYYKYGYDEIYPDYYLYFEEDRGAMQISREMCADIFEDYVGKVKKTGATQLTLRSTEAINPINVDGPQSEVLLLGHPDNHVYNGDVWPAVSSGRVYVMTSHILTPQERLTLCGRNADTAAADKRFKELQNTPGFTYMVFVVQSDVETVEEMNTTKPMTIEFEEDEEDEPSPSEEQEEEEDAPPEEEDPSAEQEEPSGEEEEEEEEEIPSPPPLKKKKVIKKTIASASPQKRKKTKKALSTTKRVKKE